MYAAAAAHAVKKAELSWPPISGNSRLCRLELEQHLDRLQTLEQGPGDARPGQFCTLSILSQWEKIESHYFWTNVITSGDM